MVKTNTRGGAGAFTERVKDVLVMALRAHFGDLINQNVVAEMPTIVKYGLVNQSPAQTYLQIVTTLPHEKQRIPTIAIMSAPFTERKLGLGRQVVKTYHEPGTGRPMVREMAGGDMQITLDISSTDTNVRSEITDLVAQFFVLYLEETRFGFLGDGQPDAAGVPANYQIILRSQLSIHGETDIARPGQEGFERVYLNRITVPLIFIDYVDREVFDIDVCFNPNLTPADDDLYPFSGVIPELAALQFVQADDFEASGIDTSRWAVTVSGASVTWVHDPTIRGNGSVEVVSFAGLAAAALTNKRSPGVSSGRVRTRFRLLNPDSAVVLFAMLQGADPISTPAYYLVLRPGLPTRPALYKGPIRPGATPLAEGSRVQVPVGVDLACQLEWKTDPKTRRIRLRGYLSRCDTAEFGSMRSLVETIDGTDAYLTTSGEGAGYVDPQTGSGLLLIDDVAVIREVG